MTVSAYLSTRVLYICPLLYYFEGSVPADIGHLELIIGLGL